MAFRTAEIVVRLSGPEPPACTCTIATVIGGCPDPSSKDDRNEGAKRLSDLKTQLHESLSQL